MSDKIEGVRAVTRENSGYRTHLVDPETGLVADIATTAAGERLEWKQPADCPDFEPPWPDLTNGS